MTIYSKAIEALKKQGWGKGDYIDQHTGCVCAYGALALGSEKAKVDMHKPPIGLPYFDIVPTDGIYPNFQYHALRLESLYKAMEELPDGKRPIAAGIAGWNDDYAESPEDVIALFERAHEIELAKEDQK